MPRPYNRTAPPRPLKQRHCGKCGCELNDETTWRRGDGHLFSDCKSCAQEVAFVNRCKRLGGREYVANRISDLEREIMRLRRILDVL
jgi:hypothetical protein